MERVEPQFLLTRVLLVTTLVSRFSRANAALSSVTRLEGFYVEVVPDSATYRVSWRCNVKSIIELKVISPGLMFCVAF
jgi:hypothetical protein